VTLLAPLALGIGIAAAAVVLGLHLLTTRRPPPAVLPTARFVPVSEARAVARAQRPTDLLLLALRMLAVLLIAAAFARPVPDAPGPQVRSVVLLDVSRSLADPVTARAAARERLTVGGALVLFDTAAREVAADSLAVLGDDASTGRGAQGALSPALLAGRRAATRIARGADSVRLVIVSPITEGAADAATAGIRAAWPGGIDLVRVDAAADTATAPAPRLVTALADDPLAPALALLPRARGAHAVRIVRDEPGAPDSVWAREPGHVLVHWPLADPMVAAPDAVRASGTDAVTVVAPLARLPLASGGRVPGRVLVRWRDGSPAATEQPIGAGCARDVGIGLPLAGDLTLRPAFVRLLARLVEPCGGRRPAAIPDSTLGWLRGEGSAAWAAPLAAAAFADSSLGAWLLAAALALLLVEWLVRARRSA